MKFLFWQKLFKKMKNWNWITDKLPSFRTVLRIWKGIKHEFSFDQISLRGTINKSSFLKNSILADCPQKILESLVNSSKIISIFFPGNFPQLFDHIFWWILMQTLKKYSILTPQTCLNLHNAWKWFQLTYFFDKTKKQQNFTVRSFLIKQTFSFF